jgi:signal transduction histidine kinase
MSFHKFGLFFLFIIFISSASVAYCYSQSKPKSSKIKADTTLVLKKIDEAELLMNKNIDSSVIVIEEAGMLARKLDYKNGILTYLSIHIKVLNRLGKYTEALKLSQESLRIAKEINNKYSIAIAYNNLGNEYSYLGKLDLAASNYLDALKIAEVQDSIKLQQKFCNNLASVFLELKEKKQSMTFAKRSYDLALKTKDPYSIASSLVNLANAEIINEHFDQAISYLADLIKISENLDDITYLLDAYINSGHVATEQKEYEAALEYYQKAQQKLNNESYPDYEMYINWGLGQSYYYLKSFNKANDYVTKSIKIGKEIQASHELRELYKLAADINEALSRHKLALDFRKKFEKLQDSLVNAETRENINKLEIEYQTSQKEKALAEQKLIIAKNQVDLEVKNQYILSAVLVIMILLFVSAFAFLIYKQKQKAIAERMSLLEKEKKVQVLEAMMSGEEKERSRLAKELHDGIGGILSATKMHLSILKNENPIPERAPKFESTLGMLDSAFKEIRSIAHNLAPEILLKHGLSKALMLFCDRVSNENLFVEFYSVGDIPRMQNNYELIIYRIVQELVNNIIKHSQATNAYVQLSNHDSFMTITVEDNGIGMDKTESNGIGMDNLKSRVESLKGEFTISSQKGKGTTCYVEMDIKEFLIEKTEEITHNN